MKDLLTQFGLTLPDDKAAEFDTEFKKRYSPAADAAAAQARADDYKSKYDAEAAAFAAYKSDAALTAALGAYKPRNAGLLKKALDASAITQKADGSFDGLDAQVKRLKETDGYLFETEKSGGLQGALGSPGTSDANAALKMLLGGGK